MHGKAESRLAMDDTVSPLDAMAPTAEVANMDDLRRLGADALKRLEADHPSSMKVLACLETAGHETWCVGGCVRDSLMGRPVHDVDMATSAAWEQVRDVCRAAGMDTIETGVAHGTLTVRWDGVSTEVTTFRIDGGYSDGRHPDTVAKASTIEEDLARRDFTVNAMAFHPKRGLLDPFSGLEDIRNGLLRTVGDAALRFDEDALRILRLCRFSSELGFSMEERTYEAAVAAKSKLHRISAERIFSELDRFVMGDCIRDALMACIDILAYVLPEVAACKGCPQNTPYHCYDVLGHTALAVQCAPKDRTARWTALLHDIGKPGARFTDEAGRDHFYGHDLLGAQMARAITARLPFPRRLADDVVTLVRHHDAVVEPTAKAVKRMLRRLGDSPERFRHMSMVMKADALAHHPDHREFAQRADELLSVLDEVLEQKEAFTVTQLAVNGKDLMEAGVPQGPAIGSLLNRLLDEVMEEHLPNERGSLMAFVLGSVAKPEEL